MVCGFVVLQACTFLHIVIVAMGSTLNVCTRMMQQCLRLCNARAEGKCIHNRERYCIILVHTLKHAKPAKCVKCFIFGYLISNQSDALSVHFCSTRFTILITCSASSQHLLCMQSHSCLARALVSGSCKVAVRFGRPVSDAELIASSLGRSYSEQY